MRGSQPSLTILTYHNDSGAGREIVVPNSAPLRSADRENGQVYLLFVRSGAVAFLYVPRQGRQGPLPENLAGPVLHYWPGRG